MNSFRYFGVYGVGIEKGAILVTKKQVGPYLNLWDLPGGGIEFGEDPLRALHREIKEEVGMRFDQVELLDCLSYVGEDPHTPKKTVFHHLGILYRMDGLESLPEVEGEEIFSWELLKDLHEGNCSPFLQEVVTRESDFF